MTHITRMGLLLKLTVLTLFAIDVDVMCLYTHMYDRGDGTFFITSPEDSHARLNVHITVIAHNRACEPNEFEYVISAVATAKHEKARLADDSEYRSLLGGDEFHLNLQQTTSDCVPELCFDLVGAFWYGGAELHTQRWPMNEISLPLQPFVTNDLVPTNTSLGNVIERVWLNSNGFGIAERSGQRMLHSYNDNKSNKMCFRPDPSGQRDLHETSLSFLIFRTDNLTDTYYKLAKRLYTFPQGVPDMRMMRYPIWSTWAKYKVDIDEEKVLEYADEILQHGFTQNSQLEIDDMFSSEYGDFDFTEKKFADPAEMVRKLKEKGFRVTVWITPFANLNSAAFEEGKSRGFWLKDASGEEPLLVKWWQGIGTTLDVTNDEAVTWFVDRLNQMKETYGIDSFKFDAGEVTYVPSSWRPGSGTGDPTWYTTKYVEAVSKLGSMIEVRCGYKTQEFPVFVRMGDKESRWGYDNGLKTLIPTVLTMGILGYPYVLPDMIGGNGYNYDAGQQPDNNENSNDHNDHNPFTTTVLPERELYIRWLELSAFLPAMQLSFVPWQYDAEVVDIAQKYLEVHDKLVTPILRRAAVEAIKTGAPLIRPLWWIAPGDPDALECDSQFLVGPALLVAPMTEPGARRRDVYLPAGLWEDAAREDTVRGPTWLRGYEAELDEVPVFTLIPDHVTDR